MNAAASLIQQQSFEITPLQAKAIQLLHAGSTVVAAARELQIDRTTVYTWRNNNPVFSLALNRARKIQAEMVVDSLQDLASTAVDTLHQLLVSTDTPAPIRLRAALAVLNAGHQMQQPTTARPSTNPTPEQHAAIESLIGPPQLSREIPRNSTEFDTFEEEEGVENTHPTPARSTKIGRNEPCPCASGLKFKRCCGNPLQQPAHTVAEAA